MFLLRPFYIWEHADIGKLNYLPESFVSASISMELLVVGFKLCCQQCWAATQSTGPNNQNKAGSGQGFIVAKKKNPVI